MATDNTPNVLPGQRVELHPATDAWMSGDRLGIVTRAGVRYASVKMDRSGRTLMIRYRDLWAVQTWDGGWAVLA